MPCRYKFNSSPYPTIPGFSPTKIGPPVTTSCTVIYFFVFRQRQIYRIGCGHVPKHKRGDCSYLCVICVCDRIIRRIISFASKNEKKKTTKSIISIRRVISLWFSSGPSVQHCFLRKTDKNIIGNESEKSCTTLVHYYKLYYILLEYFWNNV